MCLIQHWRSRLCGGEGCLSLLASRVQHRFARAATSHSHQLGNTGPVRCEVLWPSLHGCHGRLEGHPSLLLNVPQRSACWASISCLLGWKAQPTEMSEVSAMQYPTHPILLEPPRVHHLTASRNNALLEAYQYTQQKTFPVVQMGSGS